MEAMLEQLLEGQQKMTVSFNGKIDALYEDLNGKIDNIHSHMKKLDVQVAQTAEAVKRQEGYLPGKTDVNPRQHVHAIRVQEEGEHQTEQKRGLNAEDLKEFEDERHAAESMSIDTVECRSTPVEKSDESSPIETEPSTQIHCVDRHQMGIDRHPSRSCADTSTISEIASESIYKTKNNKETFEEMEELFHKARKIPPPMKQLLKVEDPGMFMVPCSIGGVKFKHSLCDSGASVNLMTKDIAEKLGISTIQPSSITLEFANSSTAVSHGIIPNLLIKVGNCLVPTDFQVVEVSRASFMPFILGRPFMATVGAIVDMPNKRMSFSNVDKEVFYKAISTTRTGTSTPISCIAVVTGEELDPKEQVSNEIVQGTLDDNSKGAVKIEDWGGTNHTFRILGIDESLISTRLMEDDAFVMETKIAELNWTTSAETRAPSTVSTDTPCVDRHPSRITPEVDNQTPLLHTCHKPRKKQRYVSPGINSKPPDHLNKSFKSFKGSAHLSKPRDSRRGLGISFDDAAGKRSIPPAAAPHFLGRSHAPTAYTPPWMRRHSSEKHSMLPSDAPNA